MQAKTALRLTLRQVSKARLQWMSTRTSADPLRPMQAHQRNPQLLLSRASRLDQRVQMMHSTKRGAERSGREGPYLARGRGQSGQFRVFGQRKQGVLTPGCDWKIYACFDCLTCDGSSGFGFLGFWICIQVHGIIPLTWSPGHPVFCHHDLVTSVTQSLCRPVARSPCT